MDNIDRKMYLNIFKIILVFAIYGCFPIVAAINKIVWLDIVLIVAGFYWVYFGLCKPYLTNSLVRIYNWSLRFKNRKLKHMRYRLEDKADAESNRRLKFKLYAITRQMHRQEREFIKTKQLSN